MNLPDLLRQKGIPYRVHGEELYVCCLFCTDKGETQDTRFRLGLNLVHGYGHCFNCGWARKQAVDLFLRRLKLSVWQVTSLSGQNSGGLLLEQKKVFLPEGFEPFSNHPDSLERQAFLYLRHRGVSQEQIRRFGIGYTLIGKYAYRIIFPVRTPLGELLGFVARDFTGNHRRRYLFSSGDQKGLFGLKANTERVVIAEGVFKALCLERALVRPCCASLGSTVTHFQVGQMLEAGVKRVVLWPDPDKPGVAGCLQNLNELRHRFEVDVVWPNVMADEARLETLRETWKQHRQATDLSTARQLRVEALTL
jgi:hypothetical protein